MLQQILLYRELDFPLKEIKDMLSKPDYDRQEALAAHKSLLLLKIERLRRLTGLVDSMMRGENTMSFQEFDMHEIEEAKKKSIPVCRCHTSSASALESILREYCA